MAVEKFIASISLQEIFRDKDTGNPLTSGTITFFEDANRTILKPVFKYTGSPGNPAFTALPNPLTIDSAGMATDAIFYFPFDASDNTDLYFVEVRNENDVLQNTREAWPPGQIEKIAGTEVDINYIPNGQFNSFNRISTPLTRTITTADLLSGDLFPIAVGGWELSFNSGSTTVLDYTFNPFGTTSVPDNNPQNELLVDVTTNDPSNTFRDVVVFFNPVNVFSSDTDKFTFSFWGRSTDSNTYTVTLIEQKFYGTGGSPATETVLTTFDLTPSYQQFTHTFVFGDDSGKTLGTTNTDVKLKLRLPLLIISNTAFTNFILTPGEVLTPLFPNTPRGQTLSDSLSGPGLSTTPDNSNIFLPVRLGRFGLEYDTTEIGKVYPVFRTAELGELLCDGSSFFTDQTSSDGIPFSRLQAKILNRFGNGLDYVTSYYYINIETNHLTLSTNQNGAVGAPANVSANITVTPIHTSTENTTLQCGITKIGNDCVCIGTIFGDMSGAVIGNGTSNLTITQFYGRDIWDPVLDTTGNSKIILKITTGASLPAAGTYFQIASSPTQLNFYVWFKVDGVGVDPAPGGTGILIELLSAVDGLLSLRSKIALALNSTIQFDIQWSAVPTAGGYWTFDTVTQNYYVWYEVDGAGTDPAPGGRVGIKVSVLSTDTTAVVAITTRNTINNVKFAVPDLRGMFLRGFDPDGIFDPTFQTERYNRFLQDDLRLDLGTTQWPISLSHAHDYGYAERELRETDVTALANVVDNSQTTTFTGSKDGRPWNMAVNYIIKY